MNDTPSRARPVPVPSGRLSRLTRLGTMTAGVAGNMALQGIGQLGRGQRPAFRDLLLTPGNMTRIADQLANMRGAAMKVGQLVSMDTGEMLPPELAQIMARLRDDAHFMPPAQLRQVLDAQWPKNWLQQFKTFDVRPIAAASIGQVHRAVLRDGRTLAIKVQYPGVARSIDSDVTNVGALIRMTGLLPKGLDLAPYLAEARQQLHDETDYLREAAQLQRFGTLLADQPQFTVPGLHDDLTTGQVLAMDFVPGRSIETAADAPQDTRDRIARDLIALTLAELFDFNAMQTDPNFANYRWQADTGRIVLLDFGAARDIAPDVAARYLALIRAGLADDPAALGECAAAIGFIGPATQATHRAQIIAMMRDVFAALTAPQIDFADQTLSRRLQQQGIALAEDGFIPPPLPIDVLLLQRKFGGIFLLAARLGASVDVMELLRPYLTPETAES
ncbi:ABC1 kinase family protein [Loktanella sp. M215]|uniref:ABC1 kinase family protein n=1 Tax=Loktanella sp. M215 TaxID=2675431 RepID=UPI001F408E3C|nr:AarF/ABC1/UbiB kinase family protein [Loktanella sp. M215]MCF7699717.1 AarF/ABC1/UbiB kinase family protein [Loktanella sp. M215]